MGQDEALQDNRLLLAQRFEGDLGLGALLRGGRGSHRITGIEWGLTAWILVGWRLPTGALLAMMLNSLYAIGLIVTLLPGLDLPNCGCYGVFFPQPLRWYSPIEDLALAGICYALYVRCSGESYDA